MERIAESGEADVAYICDSSSECIDQTSRIVPDARIASSFDELLECDLDGVVIATPSALHAEQSIRALERGFAVFCQKPLGRTEAELKSIVRAAENADRLLGVDLSYRFTYGMRQIRDIISRAGIGHVYACDLVFHNAYGPDRAWFYDPKLSGGGCVMDLGVHLVDLALWTLGFPKVEHVTSRLFAAGKVLSSLEQVEDYATATFDLDCNTVVNLACSWKIQAGCDAVISATFYGTEGGLSFRNLNGSFYDFVAEEFRGGSRKLLAAPPDAWGGRAAVAWAKQLGRSNVFDPAITRVSEVARVLDSIYSNASHHASIPEAA
jgi:predicted dehydrogenase